MASRDKILFLVGEKKAEDLLIRKFFEKFPADQQNKIAKSILCTILEFAGPDWNPTMDGYPFLSKNKNMMLISPHGNHGSFNPESDNFVSQVVHEPEHIPVSTVPNQENECKKLIIEPMNDNDDDEDLIPVVTGYTKKQKSVHFKKV